MIPVLPWAAVLASGLALSSAGVAHAGPKPKPADAAQFDMGVHIDQVTSWTSFHENVDECDGAWQRTTAAGEQSMKVVMAKALRVRVARVPIGGRRVMAMWPEGRRPGPIAPFRVRVVTDRSAFSEQVRGEPAYRNDCGGTEDPTPPEPDCGKRTVQARLALTPQFARGSRARLAVLPNGPFAAADDLANPLQDLYRHCAIAGPDALLPTPVASIPSRVLFGSRKRIIVRGVDEQIDNAEGTYTKTTIRWRMVLDRREDLDLDELLEPLPPDERP